MIGTFSEIQPNAAQPEAAPPGDVPAGKATLLDCLDRAGLCAADVGPELGGIRFSLKAELKLCEASVDCWEEGADQSAAVGIDAASRLPRLLLELDPVPEFVAPTGVCEPLADGSCVKS